MVDNSKQKIFLSHAHADKWAIRDIYLNLRALGFAIFLDEMVLRPQQNLPEELGKNIDESAWFLLLWSKNAQREWVLWELNYALERAKQGQIRLVIVTLDKSERPPEVRDLIFIDLGQSMRLGLAQLTSFLVEPDTKIIPINAGSMWYRPDLGDLKWYMESASDRLAQSWRLVVSDGGLFEQLEKLYEQPPTLIYELHQEPVEDIRNQGLVHADTLFSIGETLLTYTLQSLSELPLYNGYMHVQPFEMSKRYLSWLMSVGFMRAFEWVTLTEMANLDSDLQAKWNSLWQLSQLLQDNGLARGYTKDPVDLLIGAETPLDVDNFVRFDLVAGPTLEDALNWTHASVYLPKSRAPVFDWAELVHTSGWPPPAHVLDDQGWMLLFVPQILRELTLHHYANNVPVKLEAIVLAMRKESYMLLGLH